MGKADSPRAKYLQCRWYIAHLKHTLAPFDIKEILANAQMEFAAIKRQCPVEDADTSGHQNGHQQKKPEKNRAWNQECEDVLKLWLELIQDDPKCPRVEAIQEYAKRSETGEVSITGIGRRFQYNSTEWSTKVERARKAAKQKS